MIFCDKKPKENEANSLKMSQRKSSATVPQVTVIIPAYNCAEYIGEAIDSVLQQKGVSAEILVIDDGSKDGTKAALTDYADQIRYEYQENQGVSAARNRGIELATGEYIVFLDADDVFLPCKLSKQIRCFEQHPHLGMVHSGWRVVTLDNELIHEPKPWEEAPNLDLKGWLFWKPVFPGALMFRRSWLEQVGGFDTDFSQAEDVDLVLRLSQAGCQAKWVREPTVLYRQHDTNASGNAVAQAQGIHKVLQKFFASEGLPRSIEKTENRITHYTSLWAAWYLFKCGEEDECVNYLQRTYQENYRDHKVRVIHWFAQFLKLSTREGHDYDRLLRMIPVLQRAAEFDPQEWEEMEVTLRWWLDVWLAYHEQRYAEAAEHLASYSEWDSQKLFQMAQYCLLISPFPIGVREVNRFWTDSRAQGLIPESRRYDVALLHLSLFAQHVWSHRWTKAAHGLSWAIRTGYHPKAWYIWYRFFRSAIVYYLLQPRGPAEVVKD